MHPFYSHVLSEGFHYLFLVVKTPSLASSTRPRPLTLSEILELMSPVELEFFDKLNLELSKVDHFFIEREAEARMRSLELREQLEELKNHQRLFHVTSLQSSHAVYTLLTRWAFSTKEAHPEDRLPTSTMAFLAFARSNAPKWNRPHKFAQMDTLGAIEGHIADTAVKPQTNRYSCMSKLNPDEYLPARKQLKRAVTEHYHALEVLNNYRV
jgi:xenotropic and polytropic retrovirus receptor 1